MDRRTFLTLTASSALALPFAAAAAPLGYTPGLVTQRLGQGRRCFWTSRQAGVRPAPRRTG